jgi:hypothetical protein
MKSFPVPPRTFRFCWSLLVLLVMGAWAGFSAAQTCLTSDDMDAATRTALTNTAKRYFDMAAKGDGGSLRQNSIAAVAASFSGIQNVIDENKANFSSASPVVRPPFLLKAEGTAPLQRAEFLCGLFSANGQTTNSSEFVIPNLPPGSYAVTIVDVTSAKGPYSVSFVLQQQGTDWKLGGYYVKQSAVDGHNGSWFADRARAFKSKGQTHNAWFYYIEARDLLAPLNFMYTLQTDKLYDEMQAMKPADLPPMELSAGSKTFKLIDEFPTISGKELDLVVKYDSSDVSDSAKTFQDNMTVMQGLVTKYPELRDGFEGFVARAVEPSGRDYGSLMPMKDIK